MMRDNITVVRSTSWDPCAPETHGQHVPVGHTLWGVTLPRRYYAPLERDDVETIAASTDAQLRGVIGDACLVIAWFIAVSHPLEPVPVLTSGRVHLHTNVTFITPVSTAWAHGAAFLHLEEQRRLAQLTVDGGLGASS